VSPRRTPAATSWRSCNWTGDPFVNETIPGLKFDLTTTVPRREADAGRVSVLNAGYQTATAPTVDRDA